MTKFDVVNQPTRWPIGSLGERLVLDGDKYTNAREFVKEWVTLGEHPKQLFSLPTLQPDIEEYLTACLVVDSEMLSIAFNLYSIYDLTLLEIYHLCYNHESVTRDLNYDTERHPFDWEEQIRIAKGPYNVQIIHN